MKTNSPPNALLRCNGVLQLRAHDLHRALLIEVCKAHATDSWATPALRILQKGMSKEGVEQLFGITESASPKYTADETFRFNQFASLIRKYPYSPDVNPYDPEKKAKETFAKSEHKCSRINKRFLARRSRTRTTIPYEAELWAMRAFIAYVIGHTVPLSKVFDQTGFGPGASIGTTGNRTNVGRKLTNKWTVSPSAYIYAHAAVMRHSQVRERLFPNPGGFTSGGSDYDPFKGPFANVTQIVAYNKITFVPKTAKTLRSIAVEPSLNGFLQKGVDNVLRNFLKRINIDLSDQETNSEMARLGSIGQQEDGFVTIDLSSASDSIATEVVRDVLPPDWFEFLDSIRSKNYTLDGAVKPFHKFCSMGNGFCFPLETLLFVAACKAVGAGRPGIDFRVYGDDIIVRRSVSERLLSFLNYLGFSANKDKTFLEGPFRESCGRDWFDGEDVRPYTLDYALDSVQSFFKFLNGSLRNNRTRLFFSGVRPFLLRRIPIEFRFFRPYPGPEDTGIDSICDEFLTSPHVTYRFKNGSGSWRWKELIARPISDREMAEKARKDSAFALVYAALIGSASDMPFAIRRKTRTKVRFISHPGATSQWLPPVSLG